MTLTLVAGCNAKKTDNGGTKAASTAQSNTRTGDDHEHMGQRTQGFGMTRDNNDTTNNRNYGRGMTGRSGHRGMMNR